MFMFFIGLLGPQCLPQNGINPKAINTKNKSKKTFSQIVSNLSQYLVVVNLMLSVAARTPTQKLKLRCVDSLPVFSSIVFVYLNHGLS